MISRNTVFILGAGASVPYGFPTGAGLKKLILESVRDYNSYGHLLEVSKNGLREFEEAFQFSGKTSIDSFLEHRPDFLKIGKVAIAKILIQYEDQIRLFNSEITDNWYEYLYGKMSASLERFSENKVSFITFNYDRSLEQYLYTALKNSYPCEEEFVVEILNSFKIHHMYGTLGYLPWQTGSTDKNGRDYFSGENRSLVEAAADSIRIIHEDVSSLKDHAYFEQAHNLLRNAEHVIFLGFGYSPINLSRLEILRNCSGFLDRHNFYGTSYGLTPNEKEVMNSKEFGGNITLGSETQGCLDFLRNYVAHLGD